MLKSGNLYTQEGHFVGLVVVGAWVVVSTVVVDDSVAAVVDVT